MTTSPVDRRPTTTRSRPQQTLALGVARTRLELTAFFRERDAVIFGFAFPILLLGLFAVVFGNDPFTEAGAEATVAQYYTPAMIASGIALTSFQSLAITIAVERDDETLKRLRGTPMPPVAYFLGKIGLVLVTSLSQTALLLATGVLLLGVDLPSGIAWATFAWLYLLGTTAGTVLGIAFSAVPRSAKSAATVVPGPLLLLQFISGIYFAFPLLPTWLQWIASVFPLKWLAQGMRSVFLPDEFKAAELSGSWQLGLTAAILVAWSAIGLFLSLRTFRWLKDRP